VGADRRDHAREACGAKGRYIRSVTLTSTMGRGSASIRAAPREFLEDLEAQPEAVSA